MFSMFMNLIVVVFMLVNVAFVTLMERKILGLSQLRKGPNKVSFVGILQPISDAVKLFLKEVVVPLKSNYLIFLFSPALGISLSLLFWSLIPYKESYLSFMLSGILFLMVLSFGIYPLMLIGWSSNSKYAMIGSLRGVAQTISYEISLALILFHFMVCCFSVQLKSVLEMNSNLFMLFLCPLMVFFWVVSCVAETNRTPFDFSEGESELVSGFNVEFGAAGFTLIFMAEYSMILFLSLMSFLFLMGWASSGVLASSGLVGLAFFWVWLRSTFPRYRYDKLMNLAWKSILPLTIFILGWDLGMIVS